MRVLLMLFLLAPASLAAKDAPTRTIPVYDATDGVWRATVATLVDEFNAVLPQQVRLRYVPRPPGACRPRPHRIVACLGDPADGAMAATYFAPRDGVLVTFRDERRDIAAELVCHELMHALTRIPDAYHTRTDSCVWGAAARPGPFDIDYLAETLSTPAKPKGKRR